MRYCRTVYLLNSNLSGNKAVTISLQKSSYGFQALKSTDKNGTVFLLFLDSSSKKLFKVNLLTVSYIKVILAQGLASINSKTLARFERPKKSRLSAKNKLKRLFSKLKKNKLLCFINFNTNKDLVVEAFKKQRKAQQRRMARRTLYNKAVREDAIVSTKIGVKAVVNNGARSNYRWKKQLRGIFVRKPFRAYLNKKTRSGAAKRLGRFVRFRRTLFSRVFKKASKIKPSKSLLLSTGLRKHYYRPEPFFKYDIHPRLLIKGDFVSGRVKPYYVKAYNKPFYKKTHKRHAIRKTKPRKRKLYIASSKGSLTRRLHTLSQSPKKYSRVLRPYKQDVAKSRIAIKYFKQKKIFRARRSYYKAHAMLLRHIYFK